MGNSYNGMLTEKIGYKTEYPLRSQMWCCMHIYVHICSYICVYNLCYLIQQTPATHTHWALEMWLVQSEVLWNIYGVSKALARKNKVNYYVNNFYIDYILNDILDILDEINWIIKINLTCFFLLF